MHSDLKYRADIDGLRAIAILSVLFYHAGLSIFSGGFVGVDVFFVISGYLITSIIIREIDANEFSLINFYERRIRRIFPALFTVVIFTLLVSAWIFNPTEYTSIGESAAYVTAFISNILFWNQAGYFDNPSSLKPLLHAWSLSVEEQFYILLPILIIIVARFFKSRFTLSFTFIAIVSFILNIFAMQQDASAAFYLVQFRAWELLSGSLLALNILPLATSGFQRNILSVLGIIMITTSVVLYSHETAFPGIAALLPVAGSALIIYSGTNGTSLIGRFLSLRPIVFVGQISYSLYLWHWPLLVIGRYYLILEPTASELIGLMLVIFTVSIFSWKYIENTFRRRTFLKQSQIFSLGGAALALLCTTSIIIYANDGFPLRFSSKDSPMGKSDPEWIQWGECILAREKEYPKDIPLCKIGDDTQDPTFILWGDSHTRALAPALNDSASREGVSGLMTAMSSCPPLMGIDRKDAYLGYCAEYNNMVIQYIQNHSEIKTVILSARWALSTDGRRYKTEEGANVTLADTTQEQSGSNPELFSRGLQRTIRQLLELDRNVVIVYGVPEVGYDVPSSFSIATRTGRDINEIIAPTLEEYTERNLLVFNAFNSLSEDLFIQYIDPAQALCDEIRCIVAADGQPLYLDDDHLSPFGARYISYLFDPVFHKMTSK